MAANFEYVLSTLRQNEAHALHVLKVLRDIGAQEAELFCGPTAFARIDSGRMEIAASHRVRELVDSQVFWHALELLFAEAESANFVYEKDIGSVVRYAKENPEKIKDPNAVADFASSQAGKWNEKAVRHYHALSALLALATMLETERLNFKDIRAFRKRPEVKEIVDAIDQLFPESGT